MSIVSQLEVFDLSISHSKVMDIENGIANGVNKQNDSMDGLCLPPWLVKDTFLWYALDNRLSGRYPMQQVHATWNTFS
jgi:hypothetical protein